MKIKISLEAYFFQCLYLDKVPEIIWIYDNKLYHKDILFEFKTNQIISDCDREKRCLIKYPFRESLQSIQSSGSTKTFIASRTTTKSEFLNWYTRYFADTISLVTPGQEEVDLASKSHAKVISIDGGITSGHYSVHNLLLASHLRVLHLSHVQVIKPELFVKHVAKTTITSLFLYQFFGCDTIALMKAVSSNPNIKKFLLSIRDSACDLSILSPSDFSFLGNSWKVSITSARSVL